MKTLKCIIADDEPIARQILKGYIQKLPYLELVDSCKNAFEVMALLQEKSTDILFLDINMPKLSGLSLLKTMQQKPNVIITTAYPEYAVEGFELSVTDYMLKPFSLERFIKAVNKIEIKAVKNQFEVQRILEKSPEYIFIKSDKKIIKIKFNEILYIEAYGNYIKIHLDTNILLTPWTLSNFMDKLPERFIRVHKSFGINFNKLKLIDGNQLILQNDIKLPIGKSYRKHLLDNM